MPGMNGGKSDTSAGGNLPVAKRAEAMSALIYPGLAGFGAGGQTNSLKTDHRRPSD